MRRLLKDYLILIAQLENQLLTNESFTLHVLSLHTKQTSHMLFQLYTTGIELLKANGILEDEKDEDSADDDTVQRVRASARKRVVAASSEEEEADL